MMNRNTKLSLRVCVWELTTLCNLRCAHCGSRAGIKNKNQLSLEKCFSVADELAEIGCESVCLIGGEVTLFHGWDLILDRLTDKGVRTNIITNGYNITTEIFERIKNSKIRTVCVSVDGMEKNHNEIRGRQDCFSQLKNFIDRINSETDKYITAVTTLTKTNIDDIEELSVFLAENNVKIWQLQICSPFGNARDNIEIAPGKDDISKIARIYRKLPQSPMTIRLADNIGYYIGDSNEGVVQEFRGCAAGICLIGIDTDGNVRGCESLKDDRFIEGNLRTQTLKDIWTDENNFLYNRKFTPGLLTGDCADCEHGKICAGGCRSHNFFSHGKLYESTACARF